MDEQVCKLPMDDGVEIYCKVLGRGAPLLMIHGIVVDADFFDMCRDYLAEKHTIITYDRRGCSRSDGLQSALEREVLDAASVLRHFANGRADVVGCSAGGVVACALAQQYPQLIRKAILHELPLFDVVDLTEAEQAWVNKAHDLVRSGKYERALRRMLSIIDLSTAESDTEAVRERQWKDGLLFMEHEFEEFVTYGSRNTQKGIARLEGVAVAAVGANSRESLCGRATKKLADLAEIPCVIFPGGHNAAKELPQEFAEKIEMLI